MKTKSLAVAVVLLLAGTAFALVKFQVVAGPPQWFRSGFYVSSKAKNAPHAASNLITSMLSASATLDFAANDSVCEDLPIAVPGAVAGDPCIVGAPTLYGTGASMFSCYVSDAGYVNVRHCPNNSDGGSNPASGTYRVRVISNQ